jgi:hypothetical protein
MSFPSLHRRHFLRNGTACIALPFLESLGFRRFASAAPVAPNPKRMLFIATGWGVTSETWYPSVQQTGSEWTLPDGLKPLARHHRDITLVQNCFHKFSSDGHAPSTFWLTGANRYGEPGKSFSNTISVDQVAANQLGKDTRFESLSLSGNGPGEGGHGQMQWNRQGKPLASINDPVSVFHKLFSDDKTPLALRQTQLRQQRSVLDLVLDEARFVSKGLSRDDTDKLNEYLESIRDIETRISKEEQWLTVPKSKPTDAVHEPKKGVSGKEEIKVMYELIHAAFQTDSTRVIGYRLPVDSLLRSIGHTIGGHTMSHYSPGPRMEASQARDRANSELLAGLLDKLKTSKQADGSSLFDHTTVVFGSNVRNQHNLDNCPTLLSGKGAGVKLGHHLVMPDPKTPLCNVWLSLLQGSGIQVTSFGDSTGILEPLMA